MEKYKQETRETELAFAKLAKEQGLKVAFVTYAADDAVLNRGNKLIKGKKAIEDYYSNQKLQNVSLEWEPVFIEVAVSGDLGYTYGPYTFSSVDSSGKETKSEGIFHTVWKKQANGKWRYVWD
ncbi:MAG: nuclear transport factor 2 family protein [Calditrichaceae bacterium]|nr:nuclear transport factor 2 family protein [Calditrichaceae bacterium]